MWSSTEMRGSEHMCCQEAENIRLRKETVEREEVSQVNEKRSRHRKKQKHRENLDDLGKWQSIRVKIKKSAEFW